ncbi:MAG TPA: ComEC/Rec2 family competence protein [Halomicronema sp.]
MSATGAALLCVAYIVGLLSTAISAKIFGLPAGGVLLLAVSVGGFFLLPRFWRTGPKPLLWLIAGIIALLATLYFQWRIPQPAANDISNFIPLPSIQAQNSQFLQEPLVILAGNVESIPRLTRSGKAQFWLDATSLTEIITSGDSQTNDEAKTTPKLSGVTGKVYITAPLLQTTGLGPGQFVELTGILYKPQPPANPGAFDFQRYLAKEGCFAGFRARQVNIPEGQKVSKYGWWVLRRHIVRIQVQKLGVPEGPLLSAMTLGKEAVDLPYDVRDWFAQVGLAHAVAASGAQVSLILSVVLALTKRLSDRFQFAAGVFAITIFTGLAGFEPAVSRAALMGVGALLALLTDRKVKPLGCLLLAGTILLLFNPGWIWDIGFNLSFLATLGLVVTVPGILARLDWLPTSIASLVAVPLAASLWTLPLQLYIFNIISPYSIVVNIITSPLIVIISLGGFISALIGFFVPSAGSALASGLYYPTHWLIQIAEYFSQLPGNSVAVGAISVIQLITLYGLIALIWVIALWQEKQNEKQRNRFQKGKNKKNQKNKKKSFNFFPYLLSLSFVIAVAVVVVPVWQTKLEASRLTVLATSGEPVLVFEDKSQITLIKSGDENTARFIVFNFLQQRGVNQIDWGLAMNSSIKSKQGWDLIAQKLPIKNFYGVKTSSEKDAKLELKEALFQSLPVDEIARVGEVLVRVLNVEGPVVLFEVLGKNWLWLGDLKVNEQEKLVKTGKLKNLDVLLWSGKGLISSLVEVLKPTTAIAWSPSVDGETAISLSKANCKLYWTRRDGAIEWSLSGGFETTLDTGENKEFL